MDDESILVTNKTGEKFGFEMICNFSYVAPETCGFINWGHP